MSHKTFQQIPRKLKKWQRKKFYIRRWRGFFVTVQFRRKIPGNNKKNLFQGQSTILKHCFGIDIEWTKENFSTRGHQFYKGLFQTNTEGQTGIKYPIFIVTIGNTKETDEME